jgi:peptide chain release factor 2
MKKLKERLLVAKRAQRVEELSLVRGDVVDADFGTQIRNYVMHPYTLVKDLRTGYQTNAIESVLNGNLDDFIFKYLMETTNTDSFT